ncbi:MAG: hypothetical protein JO333_05115 [Verrucomicrobia bacterium]|nr:hypothetical protein [Verrucomicrobiota bacterium]
MKEALVHRIARDNQATPELGNVNGWGVQEAGAQEFTQQDRWIPQHLE